MNWREGERGVRERNRKQGEKAERGREEEEEGGRQRRRARPQCPPPTPPPPPLSIVAGEEKTRAFLVIASSAPLFEAQRDKRAAIYWSPHIMATFIYFRPFSFCQGLSSVWAKNRNPRCFTKYQRPPTLPSPLLYILYLFADIQLQTTHKNKKIPKCRDDMHPPSPTSQHVGTFRYDLPSIFPQAKTHSLSLTHTHTHTY